VRNTAHYIYVPHLFLPHRHLPHLHPSPLLPPLLLLLIPQETTQNLARRGFRDHIDELNAAGEPFVAGLVLLDEFLDVARDDAGVC
jgi:hypothetical protein